jgi:hypothetical protein
MSTRLVTFTGSGILYWSVMLRMGLVFAASAMCPLENGRVRPHLNIYTRVYTHFENPIQPNCV